MKYHAESPACESNVCDANVVFAEGVGGWDEGVDLMEALVMSEEVQGGEEDREGLLHAKNAMERPFPMVLHYGQIRGNALRRDDMLAGIITFRGARPEEESVEES